MHYMNKVSDTLKRVIAESGISRNRISRETGIGEAGRISMLRWLNGTQRTITSDLVDTLCDYFGLALTPKAEQSTHKPKAGRASGQTKGDK